MNQPDSKQQTIIFLHILKTAGTTIISLLEKLYPPEKSFATYSIGRAKEGSVERFYQLDEAQKATIELLYGHMGFGLHRALSQPARHFTFLRHPVERVISEYYHAARSVDGPFFKAIEAGELSLTAYVQHFANVETDNLQTRMIAGNWKMRGFGPCDDNMLALAKQNLRDHFDVIGLTERFDESLFLLRNAYDWPIEQYTRRQVGTNKPKAKTLPPKTIHFIEQHNQQDLALYQFGQQLFQEQLAALNGQAKRELQAYRMRQRIYKIMALRNWSLRAWLRRQTAKES